MKWRDRLGFNLLDVDGYLTAEAKELAEELSASNLEELLHRIEATGKGLWYKNDTNRPDVGSKGHYSDSLRGKFSVDVDDWDAKDSEIKRVGESVYVNDVIENVENMYYVDGKWTVGRTITLKK